MNKVLILTLMMLSFVSEVDTDQGQETTPTTTASENITTNTTEAAKQIQQDTTTAPTTTRDKKLIKTKKLNKAEANRTKTKKGESFLTRNKKKYYSLQHF